MILRNERLQNSQGWLREEELVRSLAGWFRSLDFKEMKDFEHADQGIDLLVTDGRKTFAIETKYSSEGRRDRLIPLWSQAMLQVARAAAAISERSEDGAKVLPLAIVATPKASPSVARRLLEFAAEVAPEAAAGIVDRTGFRMFRGHGLEALNWPEGDPVAEFAKRAAAPSVVFEKAPVNLFSDLNQWLAKVLLAPEVPAEMLSAPRARYRTAAELGAAASVAKMTATRFVNQLRREGFLAENSAFLRIVRREAYFARWLAATGSVAPPAGISARILLRGSPMKAIADMAATGSDRTGVCAGLFAAAEALGLGFVSGAETHVWLPRIGPEIFDLWDFIVPAGPGERGDLVLRQCPFPESVYRAAVVSQGGVPSTDVIQTWLDVSNHPTRGREQADFIRDKALARVFGG